jgi:uncharacterized integral membrane protein
MKTKLGISIVLALLAFTFITQNTETVKVAFLAWPIEMSLARLVFIMLGSGIIIGWSLSSYLRFARNRKRVKAQENVQTNEVAKPEATNVTS